MGRFGLVMALLSLFIRSAIANNSSAELATGGLVFTKNPSIEMRHEDLFISMAEIRVRYVFFNNSNKDISSTVAFPMPDITISDPADNIAIPTDDPQNIVGFNTVVAGRPVSTQVEQRAFARGVDQSAVLKRLGIPLAPHIEETHAALRRLPSVELKQLINLGMVDNFNTDEPRWTLRTTYSWQQTFRAREELVIEHNYKPSVGGAVSLPSMNLIDVLNSKYYSRYCIDKQFLTAVAKPANTTWGQHYLEYILVTGANWSGPIRNFRLVVDKGSADNLVSFCGQGVRKISPTQFEMRVAQFVPTANLSVLILTPSRAEAADDGQTGIDRQAHDPYTLNCDQLWHQRNSIFKAAGYCFQTPRGIRVFGNAGCRYDNEYEVPLSDRDRQVIKLTQQAGRMKRCPQ